MNFDVLKDFAPVARVGLSVLALSVHPSVPARSVEEFDAYMRSEMKRYAEVIMCSTCGWIRENPRPA